MAVMVLETLALNSICYDWAETIYVQTEGMGKEKQEELLTLKSKYQVQSVTTG
jgi:hypothetical protein